MSVSAPLIIRVDNSPLIGMGHAMRCLALAQAWQDGGGTVVFCAAETSPAFVERATSEGMEHVAIAAEVGGSADTQAVLDLAAAKGAEWVVLDGYRFDADYQARLKDGGVRLLVVDDLGHLPIYSADVILNQNIHADAGLYEQAVGSPTLLLGLQYVMMRREFRRRDIPAPRCPQTAERLLVTLGGADPENLTAKILAAVDSLGMQVRAVVGANYRYLDDLRARFGDRHEVLQNVRDMPALMVWADMAVCSGGTTVWELARMGTPAVIGQIAPAEDRLVAGLESLGLFRRVGWFAQCDGADIAAAVAALQQDQAGREAMSATLRKLIDGRGVERVVDTIQTYS